METNEKIPEKMYQLLYSDLQFLKSGMHIFADCPDSGRKMEEMIIITPPAEENDIIMIECKVISHGFTVLLQFRKGFEIGIFSTKLISGWKTNDPSPKL